MEEIISTESTRTREILVNLRDLLKGLPDLARGLSRIQYGKVNTYIQLIQLHRLATDRPVSVHQRNCRNC